MAKGLKALQDVKKMRRSVKLHESTDPAAVAVILGTILKEAIALKQMSDGFVGKGAVNELRNIRRDLVAGTIDAGTRKAEFISKYTLVLNQLAEVDDEEQQEIKQDRKKKLSNFIPSKESLVSAVMTANPVLGYGVKIATDLMSSSPEKKDRKNRKQEKIKKVKQLAEEESGLVNQQSDIDQQLNTNDGSVGGSESRELGEKQNEIQSRLDLIREELKHLNEIIERDALTKLERIDESSDHTTENLERIHKTDKNQLAFDKANAAQESLLSRENKTESGSYLGAGAVGGLIGGGSSEASDDLISKALKDAEGSALEKLKQGATGGAIGAGLMGGLRWAGLVLIPFLLKAALIGMVTYALWKYRGEIEAIVEGLVDDLRDWIKDKTGFDILEEHRAKQEFPSQQQKLEVEQEANDVVDNDPVNQKLGERQQEIYRKLENDDLSDEEREKLREELRRVNTKLYNRIDQQKNEVRENAAPRIEEEIEEHNNPDSASNRNSRFGMRVGDNSQTDSDLLETIGDLESRGNYNALVYGRDGYDVPKEADLTNMTIGEVKEYQKGMVARGHASDAVGKYQIIDTTLAETVDKIPDINDDTIFSPEVQDRLGMELLRGRGYDDYMAGEMPIEDFMVNMSKEWAALPFSSENISWYDKLAGNKSGIDYDPLYDIVAQERLNSGNQFEGLDNIWDGGDGERQTADILETENPQAYMSEIANDQLLSFESNTKNNGESSGNGSPTVIAPNNSQSVVNNQYNSGSPKSATNMDPTWWRLRERNVRV